MRCQVAFTAENVALTLPAQVYLLGFQVSVRQYSQFMVMSFAQVISQGCSAVQTTPRSRLFSRMDTSGKGAEAFVL